MITISKRELGLLMDAVNLYEDTVFGMPPHRDGTPERDAAIRQHFDDCIAMRELVYNIMGEMK